MTTFIQDNKKYTFLMDNTISLENINKLELIYTNDIYEKYNACGKFNGQLIVCNDIEKLKSIDDSKNKIIYETYEQYLESLKKRDLSKDQWIYNIINGTSEQDKILYQDDHLIIIPDYTWNENNIEDIHILTIPKDITLRTIRSLSRDDIEFLNLMRDKTTNIIKEKYNINDNLLKVYFHYLPSTYHLHIHFAHINNKNINSSVEYTHDFDSVIYNLELCSDYYKKINLKAIINKN